MEEQQFQFDDAFEQLLLAFLVRNKEFFDRNSSLVKEIYFTHQIRRDVFHFSREYVEKYGELPSLDISKNEVVRLFEEKKKKDVAIDTYLELVESLYQIDLSGGETYSEDTLIKFAQKQETIKALMDGAKRTRIGKDFLNPTIEDLTRIKAIGSKITEEGGAGMLEIIESHIDEPEYLIKPFMKPGEKGYLTAGYKVGKTLLIMQEMICLAKGIPFLGFEVPKPRKVLYIRFELGGYEFKRRLHQMLHFNIRDVVQIEPWCILKKGFNLTGGDEVDLQLLFRWIDRHEPDLLMFDPLYKLTDLNLAEPKCAIPLLRAYEKIQIKYPKLAIQFAHHMVKLSTGRSGDSWDSSYGPMQFFADMDYEMRLRKMPVELRQSQRFKLDFLTNATPVDKMELERDEDTLIYKVVTESKCQKKVNKDQAYLEGMDKILKREGKINQTTFRKFCKEELDIHKDLFERLDSLDKDKLWKVSKGERNQTFYESNEKTL